MSVTTKKQRGENLWIVSRDGQPIGQVAFHEPGAGGVDRSRQYAPFAYTDTIDSDGDRVLKALPYESSPREAAAAVAGFDPATHKAGVYKGLRFTHARIRDERDLSKGQECVVTRIARGWVYYKTIHGADASHQLILGGGGCFPAKQWSRWAVS